MKIKKIHILSFLLFITYTYPTSPVIHQFFIINPQIAFISFIFFALVLLLSVRFKVVESRIGRINLQYFLSFILLISMVISLITTNNTSIIRDILNLIFLIFIWRNLNYHEISGIIINQIYIFTFLLTISMISTLLFLSFYNPEQVDWKVTELLLHNENPAISRHLYGDFDYRLPFFLSLVPMPLHENSTLRLPLLFTEPTFLAFYALPLFLITLFDKLIRYRSLILVIFIFSLLISKSVLGLILLIFVPISYYFTYPFSKTNMSWRAYLVFIVFGASIIIYIFPMIIIDIIKYFNFNSAEVVLNMFNTLNSIRLTPFGYIADPDEGSNFLGNTVLIQRYGYVGMLIYISTILGLIIWALRISVELPMLFYKKVLTFSSIVVPALFSLKVPFIALTMPVLLAIYLSSKVQQ